MTARRARWEKTDLIPLFLAKKRRLLQMASQITGCPCLAEDIVQDTMVKLCESGIDERVQCPTAYVFRMVRNRRSTVRGDGKKTGNSADPRRTVPS
jgi:DNA-directed RNA polymerase specialized sigma24 family protein